jgi:hypothetical protein
MLCLNPECSSETAQELNVSINLSECNPGKDIDYAGYTDYGNTSALIATSCSGDPDSCEKVTYVADWWLIALRRVSPSHDDLVLTAEATLNEHVTRGWPA